MGRRRNGAGTAVLLAALALAGCTTDDGTPSAASSTTTGEGAGSATNTPVGASTGGTTSEATGEATGEAFESEPIGTASLPPFPADAGLDTGAGLAGTAIFVAVRVARQADFDRVVWEFAGDGVPGWRVGYTDDPRRDGSGDPVNLPGNATLAVVFEGVSVPYGDEIPAGVVPYDGPDVIEAAETENLTEVLAGAWYEGYQDPFVGVDGERPFRVFSLQNPSRIVIDVRDG